jgi:hypothetical protein
MLVTILILLVIGLLAFYAVDLLPGDPRLKNGIKVVLIVIAIIVILQSAGLVGGSLLV